MIATPGKPDLPVPVPESFHEQTDEELTENDIKRMDVDDQAIETILLGIPEDVYAAVNSCETAKEIWERVRQMMKADFTQIYDFLKMNQDELNALRAERLVKTHDPFALMAYSQNSYNLPTNHNDQSSSSTHSQQSFPINNKYNPQPSLNQNFMQPPMTSLEDINDPTEAMNAALILFAKAFQLTAPTDNNQRTSSNPRNRQIAQPVMNMSQDRQTQNVGGNGRNQFGQYVGQVAQNQQGYNAWQNGIANQNGTGNFIAARAEGTENGIKPGAITAEDWVILLGIALPDQEEGMLLIDRLKLNTFKLETCGIANLALQGGPNRLRARVQLEDGMPFIHKLARSTPDGCFVSCAKGP
nr:hypothetical protein [Tanacetum cinerariifolium]